MCGGFHSSRTFTCSSPLCRYLTILIYSKVLYNDPFTPSELKACIGASGSHFKAEFVCWYSF